MKTRRGDYGPDGPTTVEVDPALLERAKAVLGVHTARRAVELALREVIRRARQQQPGRPEPSRRLGHRSTSPTVLAATPGDGTLGWCR